MDLKKLLNYLKSIKEKIKKGTITKQEEEELRQFIDGLDFDANKANEELYDKIDKLVGGTPKKK